MDTMIELPAMRRSAELAPNTADADSRTVEVVWSAGARVRRATFFGEPYDEEIVMWWNFIGRDHDEVARFRQEWQARSERFGEVGGYEPRHGREWLPAPELPGGRLRSRGRHGRS